MAIGYLLTADLYPWEDKLNVRKLLLTLAILILGAVATTVMILLVAQVKPIYVVVLIVAVTFILEGIAIYHMLPGKSEKKE